jgi:hypothetical protein
VFVRRAPEHFSLVFVFVEMFAWTAMAEDPLRLRRDRYSEYSIAATCKQALDKRDQWLLWLLITTGRSSASGTAGEWRCTAIDWAHLRWQRRQIITLLANSRQKGRTEYPALRFYPAHPIGQLCGLVPVHERSAFVLRVFTRGDNERLAYAIE